MPDGPLRFDTYQEFVFPRDLIRQTVFRGGTMPGARLTMDRFWVPFNGGVPPGEQLAAHMAAAVRGDLPDARPGAPFADIVGLEPPPNRGATVYLDGSGSAFATRYRWSLARPGGQHGGAVRRERATVRVRRRPTGDLSSHTHSQRGSSGPIDRHEDRLRSAIVRP